MEMTKAVSSEDSNRRLRLQRTILFAVVIIGIFILVIENLYFFEKRNAYRQSNDALLQYIVLPDITEYSTLDDFGKTTFLRDWVSSNVPLGSSDYWEERSNQDNLFVSFLRGGGV
jgi:hypothetical protein